jgi:hypothetical protein
MEVAGIVSATGYNGSRIVLAPALAKDDWDIFYNNISLIW